MNGTKRRRGGAANCTATTTKTRQTRLVLTAVKPVDVKDEADTETPAPAPPHPKTAVSKKTTKQTPADTAKPDDDDPISDLHHLAADKTDSWETESLFEDIIDDLTQDKVLTDSKSFISSSPQPILLLLHSPIPVSPWLADLYTLR